MREQANNRRDNLVIKTEDGEITLSDFCLKYNVDYYRIYHKVKRGDNYKDILKQERQQTKHQ